MATLSELQAFANNTTYDIPYIDYQVGVPASVTSFIDYHSLPSWNAPVTYNAANNTVYVMANNVVLSGYDFSGAVVVVYGSNVTIQNSKFDAAYGYAALTQGSGASGLTITHSTFDGLKLDKDYSRFINGGDGKITISYNEFKNAPSDSVALVNGVVDHNYFASAGYLDGAHADAIWVNKTTGPVAITDNFIDSRKPADAIVAPNTAVQISNEYGAAHDITVTGNVMLGGSYTIDIQKLGSQAFDGVKVTGNYVGLGMYGDLYPNNRPADLTYTDNVMTAVTANIAPPPAIEANKSVTGTAGLVGEVLQGGTGSDHLFGHGDNNKLIGGYGRDFIFMGAGVDVAVYKNVSDSAGLYTDLIMNFEDALDKIDLSALTNTPQFGAVPLSFVGAAAFSGVSGQVHAVTDGASTWIEADFDGNKIADLRIELQGVHSLTAANFLLGSSSAQGTDTPTPTPTPTPTQPSTPIPTPAPATPTPQTPAPGVALPVYIDTKQGTDGSDHLYGHGHDRLIGGGGRDFMFGGSGDIFVYQDVSDSTGDLTDVIGFFNVAIDKIDLSALSSTAAFGRVALSYVGAQGFGGTKGEVHTVQKGGSTWVEVDMNGDRTADLRVELQGHQALAASNFILSSATTTAPPVAEAPASLKVSGTPGLVGEILLGGDGSDHIFGHGNSDRLIGGGGRDFMFGGNGDIFVYNKVTDSAGSQTDVIGGFSDRLDKFDFSALANTTQFGATPLHFVADAAFSGSRGEIHTMQSGGSTWVEIDMNADRIADMRIELQGLHALSATNFLL